MISLLSDLKKYDKFTTVIIGFNSKKHLSQFSQLIDTKVNYNVLGRDDEIKENFTGKNGEMPGNDSMDD